MQNTGVSAQIPRAQHNTVLYKDERTGERTGESTGERHCCVAQVEWRKRKQFALAHCTHTPWLPVRYLPTHCSILFYGWSRVCHVRSWSPTAFVAVYAASVVLCIGRARRVMWATQAVAKSVDHAYSVSHGCSSSV
eukprot:5038731-Alexandrium_andersonii.AAC.1